jgi:hypothetical protein
MKKTKRSGKGGFGDNPQNINRSGRKKGTKNKSTLVQAQLMVKDLSECAAATLEALMKSDKDFLGIKDDVPIKMRYDAAKELLTKATEFEKETKKELEKSKTITGSKVTTTAGKPMAAPVDGPRVFSSAKKTT